MSWLVPGGPEHDHGGADTEWRHGQGRHQHPVWPRKLWIHAQDVAFLVRYVTEYLVNPLGCQDNLLLLSVFIDLFPLCRHVKTNPPDVRLISATASMGLAGVLGLVLKIVRVGVHLVTTLTNLLAFTKIIDVYHSLPGLSFGFHDYFLKHKTLKKMNYTVIQERFTWQFINSFN